MKDKTYDKLKFVALIILPALTTFVGVTLEALNMDHSGIVVTIMTAFCTMLGTIIKKASDAYYKKKESE